MTGRDQSVRADWRVCVVGLGKIGLPLAVQFARRGAYVIGVDINPAVVRAVNDGASPVEGEAGLEEGVAAAVRAGRLRATTDASMAAADAEVIVLIVPVLVDAAGDVDFSALDAATRAVGAGLHSGALVIVETTLPVGTTRGRVAGLLDAASGLRAGNDYALAFSPERVYSGRIFADLRAYPKIVGGIDANSTARAATFYRTMLDADVMIMPNAETAEFVKLAETTYRDVNIALANEFARFADARGIDATLAFAAANTQPFSNIHQASIGVGGHCIPVYPYFLLRGWDGFRLVAEARNVNDGMSDYGLELLARALGGLSGRRVLILGLSYRANVRESAFSTAHRLIAGLRAAGAVPLLHDPYYSSTEIAATGAVPVALDPLPAVDGVIVQAPHAAYAGVDYTLFPGLQAVLDGRQGLDPEQRERLQRAGITYLGIGLSHKMCAHAAGIREGAVPSRLGAQGRS